MGTQERGVSYGLCWDVSVRWRRLFAAKRVRRDGMDVMITRRRFLQYSAGGVAYLAAGVKPALPASYSVGIGVSPNAYEATVRAVEATGEWPPVSMQGKAAVLKPNLVAPLASSTGATTDPEVARAVVDLSLEAGASEVTEESII